MRFESRLLTEDELKRIGRSVQDRRDLSRWFVQIKGRLLDRIAVQAADETVATRTEDSMVIATRTDSGFDREKTLANHWQTIDREGRMSSSISTPGE